MANSVVNYDFENPFGSGMNPLSGGSGVLEQIQEQVSNNGDVLRSMQGGIGGLPSGNLPSGGIGGNLYENAETTNGMDQLKSFAPLIDNSLFSDSEMSAGGSGEIPDFNNNIDNLINNDPRFPKPKPAELTAFNPGEPNPFLRPMEGTVGIPINPFSGLTFEMAKMRQQQTDIKDPEEQAAIDAAIAGGPRGIPNEKDRMEYGNVGNTRMAGPLDQYGVAQDPTVGSSIRLFEEGGVAGLMMKKTEIMEMPADRSKLVLDRIMKKAGAAPSNDPRLMAQLSQVLGRDG